MKPQEKAKQLYDKYDQIFIDDEDEHYIGMVERISKQCALIAVNQLINNQMSMSVYYDIMEVGDNVIYWQQVKEEIEKL